MVPYWTSKDGRHAIYHGDCLDVLAQCEASSIDAIVTDPPFYKVKNEQWDRQWENAAKFIEWIGANCEQWQRVLRANGSLYCFASPKMAARIECKIGERFNVLDSITWVKPNPSCPLNDGAGRGGQTNKETLRSYFPRTEEIIFAEHYGADNIAKGGAGYGAKCDELRGFVFDPLRAYICGEFERAGMLTTDGKIAANVACGFSASSGGMASRHYFSQSQWCLPTAEHYQAMRSLLNSSNCRKDYLSREYEDLRREYEDLRRPFSLTANVPYTDVWTFPTVQAYPGKHPCEKPLAMMEHIINASTRADMLICDPFLGSASTMVAAVRNGRRSVGIEASREYCDKAARRLESVTQLSLLEAV